MFWSTLQSTARVNLLVSLLPTKCSTELWAKHLSTSTSLHCATPTSSINQLKSFAKSFAKPWKKRACLEH